MAHLPEPLILLLGGKSERALEPKGLRPFQGHAWLAEQLERFRAAGGTRAVVVLGHSPEGYLKALEGVSISGLEIVSRVNSQPEYGPFSSIQCGLSELGSAPGAFILPIDVPAPEPAVWRSLSGAGGLATIPVVASRGGHPVRVSARLAREFLRSAPTGRLDAELDALLPGSVVRVPVSDPSVRFNLNTPEDWRRYRSRTQAALDAELGTDAGVLSLVEIGLGSLIHSLHLPASGQLLSLNQAFLLTRSALRTRAWNAPLRVSVTAALLKSLSPAGKKLTPMLAISMQGVLFSLGTRALGANLAGAMLGAALLSTWAFAQPLMVSYLIFGKTFFQAAQTVFEKASELLSFPRADLWNVVLALASAKAVAATGLAALAAFIPETVTERYFSRLRAIALVPALKKPHGSQGAFSGALRDLSRPWFVLPLILNFGFLFFCESALAPLIWSLLRPLALGYALFVLLRLVSFERIVSWLESKGQTSLSRVLHAALKVVERS